MDDKGIRINKYLSEAGVCSRREADRQVEMGNVTIDGRVAVTGDRVREGQIVCVNGKKISKEEYGPLHYSACFCFLFIR